LKSYDVGGNFPRTMALEVGSGRVMVKVWGVSKEL